MDDAGATNRLCWPSTVIMAGDGSGPQLHCARTRLIDILQGFDPQTGSDRTLHASGLRLQELTETTSGSWPRLCRIVLVTKYPLSRQIRLFFFFFFNNKRIKLSQVTCPQTPLNFPSPTHVPLLSLSQTKLYTWQQRWRKSWHVASFITIIFLNFFIIENVK